MMTVNGKIQPNSTQCPTTNSIIPNPRTITENTHQTLKKPKLIVPLYKELVKFIEDARLNLDAGAVAAELPENSTVLEKLRILKLHPSHNKKVMGMYKLVPSI